MPAAGHGYVVKMQSLSRESVFSLGAVSWKPSEKIRVPMADMERLETTALLAPRLRPPIGY